MNKEDLIEKINKLWILHTPIEDIADEIDQYAQSQTEALKKEIEELKGQTIALNYDDDLISICEFALHIKSLVANSKYGLADERYKELSEDIKNYIGI